MKNEHSRIDSLLGRCIFVWGKFIWGWLFIVGIKCMFIVTPIKNWHFLARAKNFEFRFMWRLQQISALKTSDYHLMNLFKLELLSFIAGSKFSIYFSYSRHLLVNHVCFNKIADYRAVKIVTEKLICQEDIWDICSECLSAKCRYFGPHWSLVHFYLAEIDYQTT